MGCFLSSTKKTPPNSNTKLQTTTTHTSPPLTLPFLEQKEEVKEILSETPIIINKPINHSIDEKNNILEKKFSLDKNQCHNIHDSHVFKIARIFNPKDELSREPSDMYKKFSRSIRVGSDPKEMAREPIKNIRVGSDPKELAKELSRSIRVGSDMKEITKDLGRHIRVGSDSKEMIKDIRQRSPAKYRNSTSPVRRTDHLSGSGQIRNTSPSIRSDHLPGSGQTRNNPPSRVGSGKNTGGLSRKDNGESSCRRSRSPVICGDQISGGTRNSISRCPSVRKSGKSPGRVRSELGDRRRSPAEAGNGNRENRENNNNYKRSLTSGNNESIENPLVSMECFIFI